MHRTAMRGGRKEEEEKEARRHRVGREVEKNWQIVLADAREKELRAEMLHGWRSADCGRRKSGRKLPHSKETDMRRVRLSAW